MPRRRARSFSQKARLPFAWLDSQLLWATASFGCYLPDLRALPVEIPTIQNLNSHLRTELTCVQKSPLLCVGGCVDEGRCRSLGGGVPAGMFRASSGHLQLRDYRLLPELPSERVLPAPCPFVSSPVVSRLSLHTSVGISTLDSQNKPAFGAASRSHARGSCRRMRRLAQGLAALF